MSHEGSGKTPGNEADSEERAAQGAAVDADLLTIIESWAELPAALKAGIMAMVNTFRLPQ